MVIGMNGDGIEDGITDGSGDDIAECRWYTKCYGETHYDWRSRQGGITHRSV